MPTGLCTLLSLSLCVGLPFVAAQRPAREAACGEPTGPVHAVAPIAQARVGTEPTPGGRIGGLLAGTADS